MIKYLRNAPPYLEKYIMNLEDNVMFKTNSVKYKTVEQWSG